MKSEEKKTVKFPDFSSLTNEELIELEIYHDFDPDFCVRQLNRLYGKINAIQDQEIVKSVYDGKVLDVGSGFGSLSYRLKKNNIDVTSLEPDENSAKIAKAQYGIDSRNYSIYDTPFSDNEFDTVILRECVEHLDFELAMDEIRRICSKRVLIFQTNLNFVTEISRRERDHEEFNPQKLSYYKEYLAKYGFSEQKIIYRDPIAFPLSGGYQYRQLFPKCEFLENGLLKFDGVLNSVLGALRLSKYICWRYLLIADKID